VNKHIKTFESFSSISFDFEIPTEDYIEKVLVAMGIEHSGFKFLAEGGYGFVVDLGDTILKITLDKTEAYYADKILNINSPNLVKNYKVVEIKSKYQYGKLYAIHQEKLITDFNSSIKNMIWFLNKRNPITGRLLDGTLTDNEVIEFFRTKFLGWDDSMILQCFGMIKQMYLEAQKYNLPTEEIHSNNVGFRKGGKDLVYFDISTPSESPELSIPIIEL
jgi:hypothetical protein